MNQHHCHCTNHRTPTMGKYECVAFVRGNVAYALDALPTTHVEITTGTPWAQGTIYLCGTHHTQFINRKPININVQEDTMYTDTYDQDNSFDIALAQLEGQPYTVSNTAVAGKFLIENCQHEWCIESHNETMWEVQNEVCCGVADCEHYTAMLCLTHIPNDGFTKSNAYIVPEEETMNNDICPCCGEEFEADLDLRCSCNYGVCAHCCVGGTKINPNTSKEDTMNINTIITDNAIKENNVPNSPVTGSSDRGDKWIKCVKCSKEIGSDWYHANAADLRTCMGAAPAPVQTKISVRGGFEVDVMSAMSVRGAYTWFFDSSFEVVKAKWIDAKTAGLNPFNMKKSVKGDWYFSFRTVTES